MLIPVSEMLAALRSDDPADRFQGGVLLGQSLGAGMMLQGLGPDDLTHGAGRDVCRLLGRAIGGDAAAVAELERHITTNSGQAGDTPTEPRA